MNCFDKTVNSKECQVPLLESSLKGGMYSQIDDT